MTQAGKHGIFRGIFRRIFSKVLKLNPDCLKLFYSVLSMSLRSFENAIKLICHNLETTESSAEFHKIWSKIWLTVFTPQLMFQMPNALFWEFEDHWSDPSPKSTRSGKHRTFREIFSKVWKLIPKCSKGSKYTPLWVGGPLEIFGIRFKTFENIPSV